MKILYLPRFEREYKKLPKEIQELAGEKEIIFRKNPFGPKLKTHKLHGSLNDFWAFSVGQKCKIIFDFANKNTIRFYSIGNHDIYE